jgi:hypothetical protein
MVAIETSTRAGRLRLRRGHVQCGGGGWALCHSAVGMGEWLRLGRWNRALCLKVAPAGSETREWIKHMRPTMIEQGQFSYAMECVQLHKTSKILGKIMFVSS